MKTGTTSAQGWFLGSLDGGRGLELFEVLRGQPDARRELERLLRVERALCEIEDSAAPFTHFDVERLQPVVMHRLGLRDPTPAPGGRAWYRLAAALALCTTALLALLVWWPRSPGEEGPIPAALFAPRGGEASYRSHLFAFCVDGEGDGAQVARLDRPLLGEAARCPRHAELQFAITNQGPGLPYLHLSGFDREGRRLWYEPGPGEDCSVPVDTGVEARLLGESIRLVVNHHTGAVRVVALFSKHPLDEAQLSTVLSSQRPGSPVPQLPVDLGPAIVQAFDMVVGE